MRPQPRKRFLLPILFSAAMMAVPEMAISQEIPYDYHHASSCFGLSEPRVSRAHPDGYVYNVTPSENVTDSFGQLVCPIPRIYPRHPGRLVGVRVDLATQGNPPDPRYISVCAIVASLERGEEEPVCAPPKAAPPSGRQQVVFDGNDLASVINVAYGWDHYMYITVEQFYLDRLYGYQTDFNLD